jgi:hypothetical protein
MAVDLRDGHKCLDLDTLRRLAETKGGWSQLRRGTPVFFQGPKLNKP